MKTEKVRVLNTEQKNKKNNMKKNIRISKYRKLLPDLKYSSFTVEIFINFVMRQGKKALARKIVYCVLEELKVKWKLQENKELIDKLKTIIHDASPKIRITSIKKGGGVYQIPYALKSYKAFKITLKNIIKFAKKRSE